MKYILIMVVLTFGGKLEYRKYEFINNGKSNEEIILECINAFLRFHTVKKL